MIQTNTGCAQPQRACPTWRSRLTHKMLYTGKKLLPRKLRPAFTNILYQTLLPIKTSWRTDELEQLSGIKTTELSPAQVLSTASLSASITATEHSLPAEFQTERTFKSLQKIEVTNGILQDNAVFAESGTCIAGITLERILRNLPTSGQWLYGIPVERKHAEVIAISTTYLDNYFHWLHDIIAPVLLTPDYKDKYYCGLFLYGYQLESLKLLGIPETHLIPLSFAERAKFDKITAFNHVEQGHPALIRSLSKLPGMLELPKGNYPRKIYISREDATGRRNILNDAELGAELEKHGFTKLVFSGMPMLKQIAILQSAEVVIFPQGASVINMAFCKPETKFIELYSPRFLITLGVNFANTLGQAYTAVIGKDANTSRDDATSCFTIDPSLVRTAIEKLGV